MNVVVVMGLSIHIVMFKCGFDHFPRTMIFLKLSSTLASWHIDVLNELVISCMNMLALAIVRCLKNIERYSFLTRDV